MISWPAIWAPRTKHVDPPRNEFWIDAVCINQNDIVERNHQVAQMSMIYARAWRVLVWLGRSSRDDPRFTSPDQFFEAYLRHHSYWKRAWITQEIILAQSLTVIANDNLVDFRDFSQWSSPSEPSGQIKTWRPRYGKPQSRENMPGPLIMLDTFSDKECGVPAIGFSRYLDLCESTSTL